MLPGRALLVFGVIDVGEMIYGCFQTGSFATRVVATAIIPSMADIPQPTFLPSP